MIVLNKKQIIFGTIFEDDLKTNCTQLQTLAESLLEICEECRKMPSIPQGAFAACKLRAQNKSELIVAKWKTSDKQEPKKVDNKKLLEYTPVKYNSKLMKSIWGFYNRYSPHNMKGNDDEASDMIKTQQQPVAVAAYIIAENLAMNFASGNEWKFPGKN